MTDFMASLLCSTNQRNHFFFPERDCNIFEFETIKVFTYETCASCENGFLVQTIHEIKCTYEFVNVLYYVSMYVNMCVCVCIYLFVLYSCFHEYANTHMNFCVKSKGILNIND